MGGSPFDQGSQAVGVLPPDNDDDDDNGGGDSPTGEGPGGLVPGSLLPVKDYVGSVDTSDFDIVRGIHTLVACVLRIRCRAKCGWVRKWNCFLAECVRALHFVVANMLVFTPASLIALLLKKITQWAQLTLEEPVMKTGWMIVLAIGGGLCCFVCIYGVDDDGNTGKPDGAFDLGYGVASCRWQSLPVGGFLYPWVTGRSWCRGTPTDCRLCVG